MSFCENQVVCGGIHAAEFPQSFGQNATGRHWVDRVARGVVNFEEVLFEAVGVAAEQRVVAVGKQKLHIALTRFRFAQGVVGNWQFYFIHEFVSIRGMFCEFEQQVFSSDEHGIVPERDNVQTGVVLDAEFGHRVHIEWHLLRRFFKTEAL